MRKTAYAVFVLALAGQVLLLGAGPVVPTPESVLGFKLGADNKLATYDQSIAYLKKLAAASPSVRIVEAGRTERIVAILGRNGMGKTTLMRSVIGFNHPRRGAIIYNHMDITQMKPYLIAAHQSVEVGHRVAGAELVEQGVAFGAEAGLQGPGGAVVVEAGVDYPGVA